MLGIGCVQQTPCNFIESPRCFGRTWLLHLENTRNSPHSQLGISHSRKHNWEFTSVCKVTMNYLSTQVINILPNAVWIFFTIFTNMATLVKLYHTKIPSHLRLYLWWRVTSSRMWHRIVWLNFTDVSQELAAAIFTVDPILWNCVCEWYAT
jgi:hypothetical protein